MTEIPTVAPEATSPSAPPPISIHPPQDSPKFPTISSADSPNSLSQNQLVAIKAIMAGLNNTEAAAEAGVDRKTLYNWRHNDDFCAEIRRQQELLWQSAIDRVRALVPRAIATIKSDLECRHFNTRARAAASILRLTGFKAALTRSNE